MKACGFISYVLFLACRILLFYIVCSVFALSDLVVFYCMFYYWLVRSCFISYECGFGLSDLVVFYRMLWLWLVGSFCFRSYVPFLACRILLFYIVCSGFGLSDLVVLYHMFCFLACRILLFYIVCSWFFFGLSDLVLYRMFLIYFGLSHLVVFYCMFFLWLVGSCYLIYFSF